MDRQMSDSIGLSTELTDCDGIPIVRVRGEIDLYTAQEFERIMQTGVERSTSILVVDLGEVSYVDSTGLSTLLRAHKELSARNADLYIIAPPGRPGVRRVLEITRIDALIQVRGTVEDVLKERQAAKAA